LKKSNNFGEKVPTRKEKSKGTLLFDFFYINKEQRILLNLEKLRENNRIRYFSLRYHEQYT